MPRQARIDAPGAVHHIICRGIERRKIFFDDADRDSFVARLGSVLKKSSTLCFAWALMPNHFHLLLQTGNVPIATVMRRLLTGYAVDFNHRHKRVGHLFQNRYKSILCQLEPYLLELVRYIHLNPVRARIVSTMADLAQYQYCGHSRLLTGGDTWQATDEILLRFGHSLAEAREKYQAFVEDGIAVGKRPDLTGGGLVRSAGGWQEVMWAHRSGSCLKGDERILGDSDFVEQVLGAVEEGLETPKPGSGADLNLDQVAQRVAEVLNVDVKLVTHPGKNPIIVQARSLLCYWATTKIGITETALAKRLGLTQSAVSRAAARGEEIASSRGLSI